jgi:hypothetical protein
MDNGRLKRISKMALPPAYKEKKRTFKFYQYLYILIINLLMSLVMGHRSFLWITRRTDRNLPRKPNVDWWVLKTSNARDQRLNVARDNKFLVTYPISQQPIFANVAYLSRSYVERTDRGVIELLLHMNV